MNFQFVNHLKRILVSNTDVINLQESPVLIKLIWSFALGEGHPFLTGKIGQFYDPRWFTNLWIVHKPSFFSSGPQLCYLHYSKRSLELKIFSQSFFLEHCLSES